MVESPTAQSSRAELGSVLKAVADPHRRRILALLAERDLPVGAIAKQLPIGRHAVMKHLRVLQSARLLSVRPEGRAHIQTLNAAPLRSVEAWLTRFEGFWDESLQRLKRQVEEAP